jgi:nucleoside-diphosphate-sugar epimerase
VARTRREFIHVDDVVEGMLFLVERLDDPRPINLGTGRDVSIRELAELLAARLARCRPGRDGRAGAAVLVSAQPADLRRGRDHRGHRVDGPL